MSDDGKDIAGEVNPRGTHDTVNLADTPSSNVPDFVAVPCECLSCGGPVDYAERDSDGATLTLCRGECGKWRVVSEGEVEQA